MIELLRRSAKFMPVYRMIWLGPVIVGLVLPQERKRTTT